MKILHVVRNLEIGGMERVVLALAAEQQRRGDTVAVVEVEPSAGDRYAVPAGLEVHQTSHLLWLAHRFDIIHAHNLRALRFAWLPARLNRKRLVFTKHGMTFPPGLSRWLCQQPDAIAAVSQPVFERYRQQFPRMGDRVCHIPNGMTPFAMPDRRAARALLRISDDTVLLLWVGRCVHEKGLDLLLDAFVHVTTDNTILLIVGDGPERKALEQQAAVLGLMDCVRFDGMQRDVSPYYAAADVFVLPSRTEGLPMALLEAGMAGLPVLVSDAGEMPHMVRACEGGWICLAGCLDPLAEVLGMVLKSNRGAWKACGRRLKAHLLHDYSITQTDTHYKAIYKELHDR